MPHKHMLNVIMFSKIREKLRNTTHLWIFTLNLKYYMFLDNRYKEKKQYKFSSGHGGLQFKQLFKKNGLTQSKLR